MKPSFEKYIPFKQINLPDRQWPNNTITKAPMFEKPPAATSGQRNELSHQYGGSANRKSSTQKKA